MNPFDARRDFAGDVRLIPSGAIDAVIGALSTGTAWLLLRGTHLFTNLFFFQTPSTAFHSPVAH